MKVFAREFYIAALFIAWWTIPCVAARNVVADSVAGAHVVELLPLIDLKQFPTEGHWTLENGELVADGSANASLALPYDPPAEYDFIIEFTRLHGRDQVAQMFRYGNSDLVWSMGSWAKKMTLSAGDRDLTNQDDRHVTDNGKKFTSIVKVRNSGIEIYLNDKLVSKFVGPVDGAKLPKRWAHLGDAHLGVGAWYAAPTRFTRIAIATLSGQPTGRMIEPAAPKETPVDSDSSKQSPPMVIDFSVPSAHSPTTQNSTQANQPFDPTVIERPEYQNAPKQFVKNLTAVTSMMVTIGEDGEAHGLTSDIIAVVAPGSRSSGKSGVGFVGHDGDQMMKASLEEAVRAVTLRYPLWEPGHIDISFGEKFVSHGGPSAGTAFGLLMLSTLEGFTIDPKCAVTGDITVDWKVRKVGGVTAKLRGATLDKCLYAAIPEDNEAAFADMPCLYGRSSLWDMQVFSIGKLQDAVALARTDRPAALGQAIELFADLQARLAKNEAATLHNPETQTTLKKILELAPNHLSAKYMLETCDGSAPDTLSENGTLYQLSVIFYPYRVLLQQREGLDRTTLPAYVTRLARKRLAALKPVANKTLRPLVSDITALISALDDFAGGNGSANDVLSRAQAVDARFATLGSDPDFAEKLVREGY